MQSEAKKWQGRALVAAVVIGVAAAVALSNLFPHRQTMPAAKPAPLVAALSPFQQKVLADLQRQVRANIGYKDGYYIGGEPPANKGVCTDVVIRSFRAAGVDLRREVAADIRAHLSDYQITKPDSNIDHRRCRNLIVFFRRHARALPLEGAESDWQVGDLVFWDTAGKGPVDHVGMIANGRDAQHFPTVVHHWPGLPVSETGGLYNWAVREHFRYSP